MARPSMLLTTLRWRLARGAKNDATNITRFVRRNPGASTKRIVNNLWWFVPDGSRRDFDQFITPELDRLERYGVIEYHNGWHNSECRDPFARLASTLDDWELVDAFGELALSYSQTIERRLATAIATFVSDACHEIDARRFAYIHFLDVIGVPVADWPNPLKELDIPDELNWRQLNAFLPKPLRKNHVSNTLN